jgi:hypothetical protein
MGQRAEAVAPSRSQRLHRTSAAAKIRMNLAGDAGEAATWGRGKVARRRSASAGLSWFAVWTAVAELHPVRVHWARFAARNFTDRQPSASNARPRAGGGATAPCRRPSACRCRPRSWPPRPAEAVWAADLSDLRTMANRGYDRPRRHPDGALRTDAEQAAARVSAVRMRNHEALPVCFSWFRPMRPSALPNSRALIRPAKAHEGFVLPPLLRRSIWSLAAHYPA